PHPSIPLTPLELKEATELLFTSPDANMWRLLCPDSALTPGVVPVDPALSEDEEGQEEKSEVLGEGDKFWMFEYYQLLFSVDMEQVLSRIGAFLLPLPRQSFIKHHICHNPGPFCICVTLVFFMHYRPQFHRVSVAAVAVFTYVWLVPLRVCGFLMWRQGLDYLLFLFIPITVMLWVIPLEWFCWLLILAAVGTSGSILVIIFWPIFRDDKKEITFAMLTAIMLAAHVACPWLQDVHCVELEKCCITHSPSFQVYFFQTTVHTGSPIPSPPPSPTNDTSLVISAGTR
uniref:Yip1 domain family, member 2 n=1 Tax=Scleropages formosus TaxID=113540 RepID=A0A8C9W7Z1_SCLFO